MNGLLQRKEISIPFLVIFLNECGILLIDLVLRDIYVLFCSNLKSTGCCLIEFSSYAISFSLLSFFSLSKSLKYHFSSTFLVIVAVGYYVSPLIAIYLFIVFDELSSIRPPSSDLV